MESYLQKRIRNYLDATGLSISALERKAGLKINVARNILRGQSKRPTAETLQAIATAMDCTVQDLLGVQREVYPSQMKLPSSEPSLIIEYPDLLEEILSLTLKIAHNHHCKLTLKQTFLLVEEAYAYTIKKDPLKVDPDFMEWFVTRSLS